MTLSDKPAPIGIFDSGYGGLTILRDIQQRMPDRDFIYLGDNARAPYGSRSFDVVYTFTLQCVQRLFEMGCHLVILACNTASAKALRNIQQNDLPRLDPERRVLGIIRPTVEQVGLTSQTRHIGLVGTTGTVQSKSYPLEFKKLYPDITVTDKACPMWVPLVENNEYNGDGADFFVKKYIDELIKKDEQIDTLILGCTHYPLLIDKIKKYLPERVRIVSQGELIAESLENYLSRHENIDAKCTRNGVTKYYTTESVEKFNEAASIFLNKKVEAQHLEVI
ncbi:MAG: glutamate racemase [Bacteroidales bacterium]|jgi:glutamate racemase|nr:glutamate racemase [Bacteroidales bacterium]MBQ7748939.1 glutamate racemase [Paludibacteraceae bacterium]MBR0498719.1 glutamate racemase [Paludibacteraceae bacterium]MCM8873529.1 glutamate racemase [Paludibacteraceae bacterium]